MSPLDIDDPNWDAPGWGADRVEFPKGAPTVGEFRVKVLVILAQAMHEPLPTGYACRRITEEYAKALEAAEAERDALEAKLREQALGSLEQNTDMHEALGRAVAAEAERDRLKRALAVYSFDGAYHAARIPGQRDWGIDGLTEQESTAFLDALTESHPTEGTEQ
jgi:hypothetical protein